jgi:hypothetical protein
MSWESATGAQPVLPTRCPSCLADLTTEQSRDSLTLNDVDEDVQDLNGGRIRDSDVRQTQLLAWRCRTCTAFVPAYDPTSLISELAEGLFNEPESPAPSHNPFTDPAKKYAGDSQQRLSAMTSDEVYENERYWDWEVATTSNAYSRWWCSKAHSSATRELDRRGLDRDGW